MALGIPHQAKHERGKESKRVCVLSTFDLKSSGGMPFKVIAKNKEWGKDFWNDLVGPTLGEDMDVETWIRGKIPPVLDSDGIHKTFDVKYIDLSPLDVPWTWPVRKSIPWSVESTNGRICHNSTGDLTLSRDPASLADRI